MLHCFLLSVRVLSHAQLFARPRTVACQTPLCMGILQARTLEWVAISYLRGSFRPRDQTCVSCMAGGYFTIGPLGKSLSTLLYFLIFFSTFHHQYDLKVSLSMCYLPSLLHWWNLHEGRGSISCWEHFLAQSSQQLNKCLLMDATDYIQLLQHSKLALLHPCS